MSTIAKWVYPSVSAAMFAASLSAVLRWAALAQVPWWWWMPTPAFATNAGGLTVVGFAIFAICLLLLGRGVSRRDHGSLAVATLASASLVYEVMMELWLRVPGPIVDPRMLYTVGFARVPLYVSFLALVGHLYLWIATRPSGDKS